jgi:adenylylsulfate kinase
MRTVAAAHKSEVWAVWITGLPASGKSTITRALTSQLAARDVHALVLESDALRKILEIDQPYAPEGREAFYRQMVAFGALLVRQGFPVIFDATANRRVYRERARREIPQFIEVYLDVPLETCMARDPKGIYRGALSGQAGNVPGLQDPYEAPSAPDVLVHGEDPEADAGRIVEILAAKGYME